MIANISIHNLAADYTSTLEELKLRKTGLFADVCPSIL